MCYPCTMCNGCGKLDNELFSHMVPMLRCLSCKHPFNIGETTCTNCGAKLPVLPQLTPVEGASK